MPPRRLASLACLLLAACGPLDVPSDDTGAATRADTSSGPAASESSSAGQGGSQDGSTGACDIDEDQGCLVDFPCNGDESSCIDAFTIDRWVTVPCEEADACQGSCWCMGQSCESLGPMPCPEDTQCAEIYGASLWSERVACMPVEDLCGGSEGSTCDDGELCEYVGGVCPACVDDPAGCGVGSPLGTCVPRPPLEEVCREAGRDGQQCGCDGITYASECHRRQAGVPMASLGACA